MLKKLWFLGLLLASYTAHSDAGNYPFISPDIQVCFTPGQNCTLQITDTLDKAKKSIFIQAYGFTSAPIAKHLLAAKNRGVIVKVILDKSQKSQKYSAAQFLLNHDIPVWIDYKPAIAHNKIMIVDGTKVITGSFNFTKAAEEKNAENLLIIHDPALAKRYLENWQRRQAVSEVLTKLDEPYKHEHRHPHSIFSFKF
jgi:phosphatidylserine/phosphatidylglycerophosphate/cardiolipin synthase-like enzyme